MFFGANHGSRVVTLVLAVVLALLTLSPAPAAGNSMPLPGQEDSHLKRYEKYDHKAFRKDIGKADMLSKHLEWTEILGPLAPVAISPFFALTLLSGTSILVDNEFLPHNDFLYGNPVLGNEWVFFTLLALTIFTSLPRLTKVSKAVAQTADFLETNAGILIYLLILGIAVAPSQADGPRIVYHAGIFEFSATTLLMIGCVINIIVINTIRVFFELMVFLCPVPAVDAIFEVGNKTFCLLLAAAYAFNPWLATAFDLMLFAICLLAYAVVRRRLTHYRAILIDPVIAGIRAMFIKDSLPVRHPAVLSAIGNRLSLPENAVVVKVFPDQAIGRIKKRSKCFLVETLNGPVLVKLRIIGGPVFQNLGAPVGQRLSLKPGILQNAVVIRDSAGQQLLKLCFTRVWSAHLNRIGAAIDAYLEEVANPGLLRKSYAAGKQSLLDLGRGLATSVDSLASPADSAKAGSAI